MKVLVLGAGKQTSALLIGLKEKNENLSEWYIYSPSGTSAGKLAGRVGARSIKELSEIKNPDWILIGCKPQQLRELKETLNGRFHEALYVSMLAAVTEEYQKNILGVKDLIRIMPNLAVEHGEGIILLSSTSSKSRMSSFQSVFGKLGLALIVEEKELDELTLLTGSGPAFFYEFAHNLASGFTSLTEADREKLVRQVLKGSAKMTNYSKSTLSEMTDAVTSRGGVTIAVLEAWRASDLKGLMMKGMEAGKKRAEEITSLLRN